MQSPLLSPDQKEAFVRDGFLKVAGLIPPDVVSATREAVAAELGIDDADPTTWEGRSRIEPGEAWKMTLPCRTPEVEAVGRELAGAHIAQGPQVSSYLEKIGASDPRMEGYIPVLSYPDGGSPAFVPKPAPGGYHVDGQHFVTLWPTKLYTVVFVYLSDVKPYGGATVVLPGSHRQIFEYWLDHPEAAETKLVPDLSYNEPLPVAGQAGDVIYMHYLLAHAGSDNHDDHIRYGLNGAIGVDDEHPYRRRSGPPAPDWTPLDFTLRTDNIGA